MLQFSNSLKPEYYKTVKLVVISWHITSSGLNGSRDVQYVLSMTHKCIMVKIGGCKKIWKK